MRFNSEYIQKLIKCKRIGKIIKLIEDNLYNWSNDNYESIFRCLVNDELKRDEMISYYLFLNFIKMKNINFKNIYIKHLNSYVKRVNSLLHLNSYVKRVINYLHDTNYINGLVKLYYKNSHKGYYLTNVNYTNVNYNRTPFRHIHIMFAKYNLCIPDDEVCNLIYIYTSPKYINIYSDPNIIITDKQLILACLKSSENRSQREYIKFLFYDH